MLKIDHRFATVARNEVVRFELILALWLLIVPCLPYSWWQGRNLFDKCCYSNSLFHCLIIGMDIGQVCAKSHIDSVQPYGQTCFYNFGNFKQHFQRLACIVQTSNSLQVNHAGCSFLPASSLRLRHGNPLPPEDRIIGKDAPSSQVWLSLVCRQKALHIVKQCKQWQRAKSSPATRIQSFRQLCRDRSSSNIKWDLMRHLRHIHLVLSGRVFAIVHSSILTLKHVTQLFPIPWALSQAKLVPKPMPVGRNAGNE